MAGVGYFLVPNLENFSWMTVVSAMGQMFYSLSIAMGILFFLLVLFAAVILVSSVANAFGWISMLSCLAAALKPSFRSIPAPECFSESDKRTS